MLNKVILAVWFVSDLPKCIVLVKILINLVQSTLHLTFVYLLLSLRCSPPQTTILSQWYLSMGYFLCLRALFNFTYWANNCLHLKICCPQGTFQNALVCGSEKSNFVSPLTGDVWLRCKIFLLLLSYILASTRQRWRRIINILQHNGIKMVLSI